MSWWLWPMCRHSGKIQDWKGYGSGRDVFLWYVYYIYIMFNLPLFFQMSYTSSIIIRTIHPSHTTKTRAWDDHQSMSTTFSRVRLIKGPITAGIRSAGRSESLKGQEHGWCQVSARCSQGLNYTIIKSIIYPIEFFFRTWFSGTSPSLSGRERSQLNQLRTFHGAGSGWTCCKCNSG